nr:hypothetical protein [Helicobacter sp. L8]
MEIIDVEVLDPAKLLEYKSTAQLVQDAHAKGLSAKEALKRIEARKQEIAGLLPLKREPKIDQVIFKEDIKPSWQILKEGKEKHLDKTQILQALSKSKELRNSAPSVYEVRYQEKSHLAGLLQPNYQAQASALFNKAQEQEIGFKGLLEGLAEPSSQLEASHIVKSVGSIEEKLGYYGGDSTRVDDLLRGAVIAPRENISAQFDHVLEGLESNPSIKDISPRFIKTQDNYKGAHINFTYNGVPSEIQIHTPKSWETKKKQDPYYKELRKEKLKSTRTKSELKKLRRKIKELGQESDLDISLFASSRLTSPQYSPVQSELVTKSAVDLNATQEPPLNSKAGSSSESENAYNLRDSKLNQKSTSLSGGKGKDTSAINEPLDSVIKDSTTALKIEANPAFGENFAEYAGKGAQAVAKLLKEKRGQVAGAFYREGLGHIDLVWGDSKKGLAHILERRTKQYGEQKALEFIHDLPRILQEAKFYKELENKIELITPTDMIVLGKGENNKFVLTSFRDRRSKDRFKELESAQTRDDAHFTGKSVSEPKKDDVLLPNQEHSSTTPLKESDTSDLRPNLSIYSQDASPLDEAGRGMQAIYSLRNRKTRRQMVDIVLGAFEREDLGRIDLAWGAKQGVQNGKKVNVGLSKILKEENFKDFDNPNLSGFFDAADAITEIIKRGALERKGDMAILWLKNGENYHGLSFYKLLKNDNAWLLTDHITTKQAPTPLKGLNTPLDFKEEWVKAFELKNIHSYYRAKFSPKLQGALDALIDPETKAQAKKMGVTSTLIFEITPYTPIKIQAPNVKAFLPAMHATLTSPNVALHNKGHGFIFFKEFKDPTSKQAFMAKAEIKDGQWSFSQLKDFTEIQEAINSHKVIYNAGFRGKEFKEALSTKGANPKI